MRRRDVVALLGAGVGSLAGCLGDAPGSGGDGSASPAESPDGRTDTSTDRDSERNASPNEFVHVEPVRNRTVVAAAAPNETVAFRDLGTRRRRTFLAALDRERVAARGWSFYDESRPTFVRYEGTWYRVVVAVH